MVRKLIDKLEFDEEGDIVKKIIALCLIIVVLVISVLTSCSINNYKPICIKYQKSDYAAYGESFLANLLNNGKWHNDVAKCECDYTIRMENDREIFYHSESGTFIDYDFNKSLTISEEDRVKLNASFVDSICSSEVHFFDENQRCTACGYELSGIPQNKDVSNHIDKIIDLTENGEIGTDDALECFFSDGSYSYYFPSIKSQYITVYYKDGTEQNVKDALTEGKIKISDLDLFGISYYKSPNE